MVWRGQAGKGRAGQGTGKAGQGDTVIYSNSGVRFVIVSNPVSQLQRSWPLEEDYFLVRKVQPCLLEYRF